MTQTHRCRSEKELIKFASGIAQTLQGGEVFALAGDLGSGKTTFVKGLALGLQIPITVTSPTFNLVHRYSAGRLPLIHYDLYRLKKMMEIEALDLEIELHPSPPDPGRLSPGQGDFALHQEKSVIAIEWPQLVKSILPTGRTRWIEFKESNASERLLTIA